jgi:hypothetical protein
VQDCELPFAAFQEKHFPPDVIANLAAFRERCPLLEERSFINALNLEERGPEAAEAEHIAVFSLWDQAVIRHRIAFCDYQTLSLSYLASLAALSDTKEKFRGYV